MLFLQQIDLLLEITTAIITALAMAPLAIWISKRLRLLDIPGRSKHKQHRLPTPLAGGIVIAFSLIILLPLFRLWDEPIPIFLASSAIIFIFGVIDDKKGMSAWQKFIGQILASIFFIAASGLSVHFFRSLTIPYLSGNIVMILDWGLTFFWLVGITNAFNLIDSMDGITVGIAGIAFAFFTAVAVLTQQTLLASFCAIFLGICISLYYFNRTPSHFFLGDAGALMLGFTLGAIAMICEQNHPLQQGVCWFVPVVALGLPIFDTTLVVVSRIRRRKPVFQGDCTHTYHRLVALGMDPNRAIATLHLVSLLLSLLAMIALSLEPWLGYLLFSLIGCAGLVALVYLERTLTQS